MHFCKQMDTIWTPKEEREDERKVLYFSKSVYNKGSDGNAEVAELEDALDSKSSPIFLGCGFNSHLRHYKNVFLWYNLLQVIKK